MSSRIRRDSRLEGLSIRALAHRHGVHRRMVREALASAVPAERKTPQRMATALTAAHRATVRGWLVADRSAPPKQRHTARRVWQRLVDEQAWAACEGTLGEQRRPVLGVSLDPDRTRASVVMAWQDLDGRTCLRELIEGTGAPIDTDALGEHIRRLVSEHGIRRVAYTHGRARCGALHERRMRSAAWRLAVHRRTS